MLPSQVKTMKVLLAAINSKYIHTGLGLRYVGEALKLKGHQVELLEETINTPILRVLELLMEKDVELYGFSVHIWNKPFVFRLLGMLRQLKPQAKIIVGGPEVSFEAERIFREAPMVDYIVQGEGEECVPALLEYIEQQQKQETSGTCWEKALQVPRHIAYLQEGKVQVNGGPALLEDLSSLPFPYPDLSQVLKEHKIVYYEATRGCPFNCAYCLSSTSHLVRKRPLELVLKDMDRFIEGGATLVKFVDRTYNLDEKFFLPMMEHLAKAKTQATFHFEIKADMLSERVMEFLATVPKHRFQMEIGIQSTNPPTLTAINRRDNWDRLVEVVKRLLSYGNMHIHVDLIAGLPYESLKEFKKSFNDVYGLKAHMLQLGFLKVLPGTQMRRETQQHDFRYMEEPPYEILSTAYMPYKDMQLLKRMENIFDQTYNSGYFGRVFDKLVELEQGDAFAFYEKLTNWWVEKGHYPQSHNAKSVAELLHDYICDRIGGVPKVSVPKGPGEFGTQVDSAPDPLCNSKVSAPKGPGEFGMQVDRGPDTLCNSKVAYELLELLRYEVFCQLPGWTPEWLDWQRDSIFESTSAFWRNEELVRTIIPDYRFSTWRQINKQYPIERFSFDPETGEVGSCYVLAEVQKNGVKVRKLDFFNKI